MQSALAPSDAAPLHLQDDEFDEFDTTPGLTGARYSLALGFAGWLLIIMPFVLWG